MTLIELILIQEAPPFQARHLFLDIPIAIVFAASGTTTPADFGW
jgi:hypothetical protein